MERTTVQDFLEKQQTGEQEQRPTAYQRDGRDYVLDWLCAGPGELRTRHSLEIDTDKRLERLLETLRKDDNVVRLRPRRK